MPLFVNSNRNQLRQMYFDAWEKHRNHQPMQPLEAQIADIIEVHPEYHALFTDAEKILDKDWLPEGGASNPFLHMGLHLAVRDQIATDRPAGIRSAYQALASKRAPHDAEHQMIQCLAEALWNAQRSGQPPDEAAYLAKVRSC
jgi:Domain of unknown function (DUF1841)